jgi:kynurenine formamidase
VIFRTGLVDRYGFGAEYFATLSQHPALSWDLIDHLLGANVSFIGIDAPGVRQGDDHLVADKLAESGGTYIIENLANVDRLATTAADNAFRVFTGWTGFRSSSGLSCRVIADVENAEIVSIPA